MSRGNFSDSSAVVCVLYFFYFRGVSFFGALAKGSIFKGADLTGADLESADLE